MKERQILKNVVCATGAFLLTSLSTAVFAESAAPASRSISTAVLRIDLKPVKYLARSLSREDSTNTESTNQRSVKIARG